MYKKSFTLLICFLTQIGILFASVPAGYYSSAEGKTGEALKTALFNIINSHTQITYTDLWTAFQATDVRSDGKVWDIYSNTTNYTFVTNQCGTYGVEGDCYNREHSFPKSWFGISSGEENTVPMGTDLFHLYPSDGYVNGRRSNYPFGEVGTITYSSNNSYSKLGSGSSSSGYTGTVFEPNDDLKGDMARTYFYMVTAYQDRITSWATSTTDGSTNINATTYPSFNSWSQALFLKWNTNDAVSTKETNRNDEIYNNYQHNRNPFIDHPELADYIWGNKVGQAWYETTTLTVPTVTTPTSTSITSSSANLGGNITSTGNGTITESGVYYSTTNGFTDGTGTKIIGSATTIGTFSTLVNGLNASTTYYYKAFATNSTGTGYSTQANFITSAVNGATINSGIVRNSGETLGYGKVTKSTIKNLFIKTKSITGDLTVSISGTGFSASTSSISQTDAENGYNLDVTFSPTTSGSYSGTLTISGGGLSTYEVSLSGSL